jgi:hypothetical protein
LRLHRRAILRRLRREAAGSGLWLEQLARLNPDNGQAEAEQFFPLDRDFGAFAELKLGRGTVQFSAVISVVPVSSPRVGRTSGGLTATHFFCRFRKIGIYILGAAYAFYIDVCAGSRTSSKRV